MNLYTKDDVANIIFHNIEDRKKRIKKLDNWLERGILPRKGLTRQFGRDLYFFPDKLEAFIRNEENYENTQKE